MLIYPVGRAPVRGAPSCSTSGWEIATSLTGGLTASAYFDPAIPILGTYPTHIVTHVKWYIEVIYCSIICDSKILATTQMCKADWLNYGSNTIEYCARTHTHTLWVYAYISICVYTRVSTYWFATICGQFSAMCSCTCVSREGNNSLSHMNTLPTSKRKNCWRILICSLTVSHLDVIMILMISAEI